jgi:TolA-binding protein
MDDAFGMTYLLAGKVDEALPYLERAARSCSALDHPLTQTAAHLHLGTALEARGDRPGACAAYRTVLERWGAAKPRSVSAEAARARSRALGCGG